MKKSLIILGVIVVVLVSGVITLYSMDNSSKEVLYVLSKVAFDHSEFTKTKNMLEDNGVKVTLASTVIGEITDDRWAKFESTMLIKDVNVDDYDMIIIVGGDGMVLLKKNEDLKELLQKANEKGKYIGAICYGPSILATSGILEGKEATVYPNLGNQKTLKENGATVSLERLVVVDNIFTAQSPKETDIFGEKMLELLGLKE